MLSGDGAENVPRSYCSSGIDQNWKWSIECVNAGVL